MNHKPRTKQAFTLIELMAAIGILAMVLSFAGVIFKVSIGCQRMAIANAEIMQKLRAITDQLNADFEALRKDGEIFLVWVAKAPAGADPRDPSAYERLDRIMFFVNGDFQSYGSNPMLRGNVARISYMLAKKGNVKAQDQDRERRILARAQYILTADPGLADFLDPGTFTGSDQEWYYWNNRIEYDKIPLEAWKDRFSQFEKADMLSVISGIRVDPAVPDNHLIGATVDPANPSSIHMLLCEGVGQFKIQGWYDALGRWVPQIDPDGDGNLADMDFLLLTDPTRVPGLLYPYRGVPPDAYGGLSLGGLFAPGQPHAYPNALVDQAHFSSIPGLGRALKFTFTLYDSKGVIERGMVFTHIVYLGN